MEGSDRMKKYNLLAAILLTLPVYGQDLQLHLDTSTTKIDWTLGDVLHTVHGTFKLKRGDIRFDPASGQASGELVVDATSGESGSGARDSRMHKNVLESGKYPEIRFVPDRVLGSINLQGDSDLKLHGAFTIHGATHEVTLLAKTHIDRQKLTAVIDLPVPYVKWGMKDPSNFLLKVKDTVEIEIHAAGQVAATSPASAR
jgi:polyisoprenoid-binding protein YceI